MILTAGRACICMIGVGVTTLVRAQNAYARMCAHDDSLGYMYTFTSVSYTHLDVYKRQGN